MCRVSQKTLAAASLALAACSGGGGNNRSGNPVAPANSGPQFTSANTVSVEENTAGAFYVATANDADGDTLTFALNVSGDGALFSLDASNGDLRFLDVPDFESPADVDADNVYEISISVSDGTSSDTLSLTITVTNVQQAARLALVASGFSQPLYLEGLPDGTGRVLVLEKTGLIHLLNPNSGTVDSVPFLDLTGSISSNGERGLLGLTFSPDFENDRTFFVNVTNLSGDTEIRRYQTFATTSGQADPASEDIILTIAQPASNHNAGWIGFDANGFLIIPTGDGGGSGDPFGNARDPNSLLGKVLRIDVTADDFPGDDSRDYAIPNGNTFDANPGAGAPEIYAIGLRNPYRASFDPGSGDLLIADVGQNAIEEIDRLPMTDSSFDFGWNLREGTLAFNGGANDPSFAAPVAEYGHGTGPTEGRSITGGYVYTGPVESFQNQYIFADFISSNIWSVPVENLINGQTVSASEFSVLTDDIAPQGGTLAQISSFGLDTEQNLYVISLSGVIYRLDAVAE